MKKITEHEVMRQCKAAALLVIENDNDPDASVATAKSIMEFAKNFMNRQPKVPPLPERYDALEKAAWGVLEEMGGVRTRGAEHLERVLLGKSDLYLEYADESAEATETQHENPTPAVNGDPERI